MPMYRLHPDSGELERFRSTGFSSAYQEQHLENWLEAHPGLLTDDEPVLIIGRQVNTALGGTLDLLALDADGSTIIVELKRALTPRDVIAQVLEYAAWVGGLTHEEIVEMAESYLAGRRSCPSLAEAWAQIFYQEDSGDGSRELPLNLRLNGRQRLIVLTEGSDERVLTVARYLRSVGVDIAVLDYAYYRTGTGEEILNVTQRVGHEDARSTKELVPRMTEDGVLEQWGSEGAAAYVAFRDALLSECELETAPRKTVISFYKHIRDGRVFVCYFYVSHSRAIVYSRVDSLADYIDTECTIKEMDAELPADSYIRRMTNDWSIEAPCTVERARLLGQLVLRHVALKIE